MQPLLKTVTKVVRRLIVGFVAALLVMVIPVWPTSGIQWIITLCFALCVSAVLATLDHYRERKRQ